MEPTQQQRKQFKTAQDWYNFLQSKQGTISGPELFELRKGCYGEFEALRGRPLLIYATKFLDGGPPGMPNQIDLPDVDGFTDLINSVDNDCKSVDVLLHSPGGRPDATERIVGILRNRFQEVNFIPRIPQPQCWPCPAMVLFCTRAQRLGLLIRKLAFRQKKA